MILIGQCLALLGRHGAIGFALSIFLGVALPQFASHARPLLPVSIFCFTVIVFLRADPTIIAGLVRRPTKLLQTLAWLLFAPFLVVGGLILIVGREMMDPGLLLGLAMLGAAPPIMSSPAVAILFGFEPSLIIAGVLGLTFLCPLLSPLLVDLLAGQAVPLDRVVLTVRLTIFIGGGFLVAMALRRLLGPGRVAALKSELDGIGVVMYFIFAVAAMDGVTHAALTNPKLVASFLAYGFGLAGIGIILSFLALRFLSLPERFIIGYATLQRNMGLIIAVLGTGVPPTTYLFFALAQFPIYLAPWLLTPLAKRIGKTEALQSAASN